MNQTTHHDMDFDARLTAYALGELEADDAAAIETALDSNPDARQAVEEIRRAASALGAAFGEETAPALTDDQRRTIESGPAPAPLNHPGIFRARSTWLGLGGLAAAAVGLAIVLPFLENGEARFMQRAADDEFAAVTSSEAADPEGMTFQDGDGRGLTSMAPGSRGQSRDEKAGRLDEMKRSSRRNLANAPAAEPAAPGESVLSEQLAVATPPAASTSAPASGARLPGTVEGSPWSQNEIADVERIEADAIGGAVADGGGAGGLLDAPADDAVADRLRQAGERLDPDKHVELRGKIEEQEQQFKEQDLRPEHTREGYDHVEDNPFIRAADTPFSTLSIDVDTASYANVRRFLNAGQLPPPDAVRIEELVNYFRYDYEPPSPASEHPFAAHIEVSAAPWAPSHRLVKIGLKGREIDVDMRPATNIVFLLDVSGSMNDRNKLPLVKQSMRLLLDELGGGGRDLCGRGGRRPGLDVRHAGQSRVDRARHQRPRRRRLDERRRGHPRGVRAGPATLHRGRREPRDPLHRRRLQRRRVERRRARATHRGEARDRCLPQRLRIRHRQRADGQDGEARPARQRRLRVHRFAQRGEEDVRG
jgi:Ca-activated chloride channel family protein